MWARLAVAAAAVTTLAACNHAATSTAAQPVSTAAAALAKPGVSNDLAAIAGAYALVSVDGHSVPYSPAPSKDSPSPTQVASGTLDLRANGTFELFTQYRFVEPQGERSFKGEYSGSCAPDGDGYRFFWTGGGETPLKVSGDTLLLDREGQVFRYQRRR